MSINGLSDKTYIIYTRQLAHIALHFDRLPIFLNKSEVEEYLYLVKQKYAGSSETFFKHTIFSLRYLFRMEGLDEMRIQLPSIKKNKRLPVVLSKMEVTEMLNKPRLLKHRVLIALLYGCGLRCFEVRNVQLSDLDFERSVLHVREGKGKKDRYVPLGDFLVSILKNYIEICRPEIWLFNGKSLSNLGKAFDKKFSQRGIQWAVNAAAKLAGINKNINVHTLRHTFATHLLENGVDIISIKELLGHSNIQTTLIYLHIANYEKKLNYSLLDNMEGLNINKGLQFKLDLKFI